MLKPADRGEVGAKCPHNGTMCTTVRGMDSWMTDDVVERSRPPLLGFCIVAMVLFGLLFGLGAGGVGFGTLWCLFIFGGAILMTLAVVATIRAREAYRASPHNGGGELMLAYLALTFSSMTTVGGGLLSLFLSLVHRGG